MHHAHIQTYYYAQTLETIYCIAIILQYNTIYIGNILQYIAIYIDCARMRYCNIY